MSGEGRGDVCGPCDGDEVGIFFRADDDFLLEGLGGDFRSEGGGGFFHERAAVHQGGDGGGIELAGAEGFAESGGLEGGGHLAADELDLGGVFGGEVPAAEGEGGGGAEECGEEDGRPAIGDVDGDAEDVEGEDGFDGVCGSRGISGWPRERRWSDHWGGGGVGC